MKNLYCRKSIIFPIRSHAPILSDGHFRLAVFLPIHVVYDWPPTPFSQLLFFGLYLAPTKALASTLKSFSISFLSSCFLSSATFQQLPFPFLWIARFRLNGSSSSLSSCLHASTMDALNIGYRNSLPGKLFTRSKPTLLKLTKISSGHVYYCIISNIFGDQLQIISCGR